MQGLTRVCMYSVYVCLRLLASPEPRLTGLPCSVCTGTPHGDGSTPEGHGCLLDPTTETSRGVCPPSSPACTPPSDSGVALQTAAVVTQQHTAAVAAESLQSFSRIGLSDCHLSAVCDSKLLALHELESVLGMAQ